MKSINVKSIVLLWLDGSQGLSEGENIATHEAVSRGERRYVYSYAVGT